MAYLSHFLVFIYSFFLILKEKSKKKFAKDFLIAILLMFYLLITNCYEKTRFY